MRLYYDFHIHSALSPCADDDMTPGNIVNMAALKGLDAIAISDHNAAHNLPAAAAWAQECGVLLVPAIELNSAEEVHLLALFETVEAAVRFGGFLYDSLPDIKNVPDFFGNQLIMNGEDEVTGHLDKLLISALPFSMDECFSLAAEYGGCIVPAHVNKGANSVFANLGFFPPHLRIKTIETVEALPMMGDITGFETIHSSDAHQLADIAEKGQWIEVEERSAASVIKKLCK